MGQAQSIIIFKVELLFQEVYNLILSFVYLWEPLYGEGSLIKR